MTIRKGLLVIGLSMCAVLATGTVYAAYTLTDNASPFGVQITVGRQAGYYLMGDESITGNKDTEWSIVGALPMTDGVPMELALPVGAQFKVAYFADGTIADDAWYNTLATSYPFAFIEDKTNNVQIKYARTYQITFDETNKEISIVDKNGSIYTPGYYFADVSEASDFSRPLNDANPGKNTASKDGGYALAKDHAYKVLHTDGYATPSLVTKGDILGGDHDFATNVEGGIQINYVSTYGIYYKESEGLWLVDKNPAPYADYKDNYFIKIGDNDPVVSGASGDNKGQWLNVKFDAPATVTFVHSTDGYSLDTGVYKNGNKGPVLENDSYQVTESGTYNIYLNHDLEVYFEKQTPPTDEYYVTGTIMGEDQWYTTVGYVPELKMSAGTGGNLAVYENLQLQNGDALKVIKKGDAEPTYYGPKDTENNWAIDADGVYNVYLNSAGEVWVSEVTYTLNVTLTLTNSPVGSYTALVWDKNHAIPDEWINGKEGLQWTEMAPNESKKVFTASVAGLKEGDVIRYEFCNALEKDNNIYMSGYENWKPASITIGNGNATVNATATGFAADKDSTTVFNVE